MYENERQFRKAVARMPIDTRPDPAHKARLRQEMLATFGQSARSAATTRPEQPPRKVRFWRTPAVKLAVAAAVLIAAGLGVISLFSLDLGPATVRQVCQATWKMPWLQAVVTEYRDGQVETEQHWYDFAAKRAYVAKTDGVVLAWEFGDDSKRFTYSPRVRKLAISDLPEMGPFGVKSAHTLVDAFGELAEETDSAVHPWTDQYDGRTVRAYELEKADPGLRIGDRPVTQLRMKVLADPETNRIAAAHIEHRGAGAVLLARQEWVVSYPQSGPRSIYDLGVPRSASVVDMRPGYRGTPGDSRRYIGTPADTPTPSPSRETGGTRKLVPLEIDLPRAMFVGTPQNNRVPHLARPRSGPRPPFLAPAGTTNVARGKPVSTSDPDPVMGRPEMITDGDKEAADGSFVELGPSVQHVTIDLRDGYEIFAIVVWHYHQQPRVYYDVVVQVCDEPSFARDVTTVFNNDINNSIGFGEGRDPHYTETNEGRLIDCKGVRGRYVRLYSNGNTSDDQNHYIEVEVYGRQVQ
jgi:hypothetical protein